jgi:polysaccharide biosynthesis/export protein
MQRYSLHLLVAALTIVGVQGGFWEPRASAQVSGQSRPAGQSTPAQGQPQQPTTQAPPPNRQVVSTGVAVPTDYVIGPDDVLGILFWRDQDMSGDVTVRPDGMITLPLIRDIKAAGLKPEELRDQIVAAAAKFISDPNVTVFVRQINSRNVFITGQVVRPGGYAVSGQMKVLQVIALAGGLSEYANGKKIRVMREDKSFLFNYNEVLDGKKLEQNIVLKPGDTIIVP